MVAANTTPSFPSPPFAILPSNWRPPSMIWAVLYGEDDLNLSQLECYSAIAAFVHYSRKLSITWDSPGRCLLVFCHERRGKSYRWLHRISNADAAAVGKILAAITADELAKANRQPFAAGVVSFNAPREVHA